MGDIQRFLCREILCNNATVAKPAGRISLNGDAQVWGRDLEDVSKAVGLFNLGEQPAKVTVTWQELGIKGPQMARDLWRQKNLGSQTEKFETTVPSHGVVLIKIIPETKERKWYNIP